MRFRNFMARIYLWQNRRFLWGLLLFVCVMLVEVAHLVFQEYAFMRPCEQCVYIRFAFCVMGIGAIFAIINPKNKILRFFAYLFAFYGAIRGLMFSFKLNAIHHAAHGDDPFGIQGCSAVPSFDFNLPLHLWIPSYFNPTGDCGFDAPSVPEGIELSGFRASFVEFYSNGWYLIPSAEFGNMAQCCALAFGICVIILIFMAVSNIWAKNS